MSKVQARIFHRFIHRLFGVSFVLALLVSIITPSPGICATETHVVHADFTVSQTQLCKGMSVTFNSTTTGNTKALYWDVDNNGSIDYIGTSVTHTYANAGTYSVRLVAYSESGADVEIKENLITVYPQTQLYVSTNNTAVCAGSIIMVSAVGADMYRWEYSDGTKWSGLSRIAFQPKTSGTLTVTGLNAYGCTEVKTVEIKVWTTPTAQTFIQHPTNGNNGILTAFGQKGLPPYLYKVNSGGYTYNNVFSDLPAGVHTLYVKDANGCVGQTTFQLNAPIACGQPQNLTMGVITPNTVDFTWREVAGANSYTTTIYSQEVGIFTFETNIAGIRLEGLTPNTVYRFSVKANCENGSSASSEVKSFTTPEAEGCQRPNVWVNDVTTNSATIRYSLTNSTNTVNSVYIWYRKNGAFNWSETKLWVFEDENNLYNLLDLAPDTEYEVKVGAVCRGTEAMWSESINFRTKSDICPTPQPIVSNITATSSTIRWGGGENITAHTIRWKLAGTNRWNTRVFGANVRAIITPGLRPGSTYDVRVTGICGNIESEPWFGQFNTATAKAEIIADDLEYDLSVYPNPTSGSFEVKLNGYESNQGQLRIIDLTGKVAFSQQLNVEEGLNHYFIQTEHLSKGIYLLEIQNGETSFTQKLIIE
jgi:PKD repeat protein